MNGPALPEPIHANIAAVERDTGLSKDTLRIWERRYGFPQPLRDAFDERIYPVDQIQKLRLIRRLLDAGYRPGRIIGMSIESLKKLADDAAASARNARSSRNGHALRARLYSDDQLRALMALVKSHHIETLRERLVQALTELGLAQFVTELVAPMNELVGDAWTSGYFEIYEEHLYTESIQVVLRNAINQAINNRHQSTTVGTPRILLTTFPQEPHGLGLLMAEAMFVLHGATCISLGVQTPVWDIAKAAQAQRCDVVALSFSGCLNANVVIDGLAELYRLLPEMINIWAGGGCQVLHRKHPKGCMVLKDLHSIAPALNAWRARQTLRIRPSAELTN